MRGFALGLLLIALIAGGTGSPARTWARGAQPSSDLPPSASLQLGQRTIPGSLGSYCWGSMCVDMASDEVVHPARAVTGGATRLTIVIASLRIRSIQAQAHPWLRSPLAAYPIQRLRLRRAQVGNRTVVTLYGVRARTDQVLDLFVSFAPARAVHDPHLEGGDATYVWRLNPKP